MIPCSEFRADLHCHSLCSDGSDTPAELVTKAHLAGLSALSITDHDGIEAYTPEIFALAESLGLRLLPGVELSTEEGGMNVHILGYGFDLAAEPLLSFLQEIQGLRNLRNRLILEKLAKRQMFVSEEELHLLAKESKVNKSIGRPHIASLLMKKGYVRSFQEAFEMYLKDGGECYVPGFKYTPRDAIGVIHKAFGKAVLAHPHFIKKGKRLRGLLDLPFDGIECYYGQFPKSQAQPFLKIALEKGWIATGGSDYHGGFKPAVQLGCSWVNEETFKKLSG